MTTRIFIDGQAGTLGLRIRELLAERPELRVLEVEPARRKDAEARRALLREADVAILCLPDNAARDAVQLAAGSEVRIIDGSTAHRVDPSFVYGLPELAPEQRQALREARRVSNPGCYPTGVILLLRPLVDAALLPADTPLSIHALSGYSGGGHNMIERWEAAHNELSGLPFEAPYALERRHKHVPEMRAYSGLSLDPQFAPAVGPFRCGMRVQIPVHAKLLAGVGADQLQQALRRRYAEEPLVNVQPVRCSALGERDLDPQCCNGSNRVELHVLAHPDGHVVLVALLDNLGKGASGAAVQSLNLMLGLPELQGLEG